MSADDTRDNVLVPIQLGEIRRIRDSLARVREESNLIRTLWVQVASLYQRLGKEAEAKRRAEATTLNRK